LSYAANKQTTQQTNEQKASNVLPTPTDTVGVGNESQSMWAERERSKFPFTAHTSFCNSSSPLHSRSHDLPLPLHRIFNARSCSAPAHSIFSPAPLPLRSAV